jgi:phosphopantothenoylcysteine decarboxylase/phosphopantothenate--cysteine ligase
MEFKMLRSKNILIGITGGIAAYKIPLLVRLLVKAGAQVKVVLTPTAKDFVTPLTLSTLTGDEVYCTPFDPDTGSWKSHIELALWADLFVIAPATANTMAKMANGISDTLLVTTYLSARCPVMIAPAMDLDMYQHPTTKENLKRLTQRGHYIIQPGSGELASGLTGEGRMEEPEEIFKLISQYFSTGNRFHNKNVLITAGPTYEPIDPVRFIGNHSSGTMGFALAEAFARQGAQVYLISGPTQLTVSHPAIQLTRVTTAQEMAEAASPLFETSDIAVFSAAVADFTPTETAKQKKKKSTKSFSLELKPTIDILHTLGNKKRANQIVVGFALETENALEHALQKKRTKNADIIVVNSLEDSGAGFGLTTNKVSIINTKEEIQHYPLKSKNEVAEDILDTIYTALINKS